MDETAIPPADPLLATTADRLHSAAIHLLRRLRKEDAPSGLTAPRLSALSVIVYAGPLTLTALADAEQVRPPTMTRIVDALVEARLAVREPSPRDQRNVLISATAAGKTILEQGRARRTRQLIRQLASLPTDELEVLHRAAEILDRVAHGTT
jgi:DNA-binding MarR family transcriptional regulator